MVPGLAPVSWLLAPKSDPSAVPPIQSVVLPFNNKYNYLCKNCILSKYILIYQYYLGRFHKIKMQSNKQKIYSII